MYGKPRIVIVEQHTLVAEAVKKLLEEELGLGVLATLDNSSAPPITFDKLQPDVILFHIYKPYTAGLESARQLKATYPRVKIIVLTTNENPQMALDCMNT